jgi:hypothetical protein
LSGATAITTTLQMKRIKIIWRSKCERYLRRFPSFWEVLPTLEVGVPLTYPFSKMQNDAAFQAIYTTCCNQGLGGDILFVESFFSFLRRKTDLLNSPQSTKEVTSILDKHAKQIPKIRDAKAKTAGPKAASKPFPVVSEPARVTSKPAGSGETAKVEEISEAEYEQMKANPVETKEKEEDDNSPPPVGNGGRTDKYIWTQTLKEVTVSIALPGATGRSVIVDYTQNTLKVGLKGQPPVLDGQLVGKIHVDSSTWTLEDGVINLELSKVDKMNWWAGVLVGDPTINTRKIVPENSKLDDLDRDTRSTVEKMMFDQRQKQRGLPSSDELQKQEAIKKFMAMHPEMDFSQAKIN